MFYGGPVGQNFDFITLGGRSTEQQGDGGGEEPFRTLIKPHVFTGVVDLVSFWFSHPLIVIIFIHHLIPLDRDTAEEKWCGFKARRLCLKYSDNI